MEMVDTVGTITEILSVIDARQLFEQTSSCPALENAPRRERTHIEPPREAAHRSHLLTPPVRAKTSGLY